MEIEREKLVPIEGNTYAVRDDLKKIGARWFQELKQWRIPVSKIDQANEIVKNGTGKPFKFSHCQTCGEKGTKDSPIYSTGECSDCYCRRKSNYYQSR